MPGIYCQCLDEDLGLGLQRLALVELLELRTCLTVAEKALLWQAPRIGLEASMTLEAIIIVTAKAKLTRREIIEAIAESEMRSNR